MSINEVHFLPDTFFLFISQGIDGIGSGDFDKMEADGQRCCDKRKYSGKDE